MTDDLLTPPPRTTLGSMRPAKFLRAVAVWACVALMGCAQVTVYQPLAGLHRPVVVDRQAPNFEGVRLRIHCPPGAGVAADEAQAMCDKVSQVFENQGALVTTSEEANDGGTLRTAEAPHLMLEIRTRETRQTTRPLSRMLWIASLTLVPAISEITFTQDLTVRDGSGFLLASDTLRGRLVQREGFGVWAVNKALDEYVRRPEEKLTGEAAKRHLSEDLYGRLSQLTYNAKIRRELLVAADAARAPR
jgi:hypothetical protein